ncbi:MAG: hypothetical protein LBQ15_08225 [Clostridium sp.]|jgi:hypothetical protein|nr:hypothetical protein [Clostridium sp.]
MGHRLPKRVSIVLIVLAVFGQTMAVSAVFYAGRYSTDLGLRYYPDKGGIHWGEAIYVVDWEETLRNADLLNRNFFPVNAFTEIGDFISWIDGLWLDRAFKIKEVPEQCWIRVYVRDNGEWLLYRRRGILGDFPSVE